VEKVKVYPIETHIRGGENTVYVVFISVQKPGQVIRGYLLKDDVTFLFSSGFLHNPKFLTYKTGIQLLYRAKAEKIFLSG
jgi:hypothetical protein